MYINTNCFCGSGTCLCTRGLLNFGTHRIVGNCPHCGGPVYENRWGYCAPSVSYSCDCRYRRDIQPKVVYLPVVIIPEKISLAKKRY